ncbi:hypothetical protein EJ05DRAFT_540693 [Pseudovirgaria hyperparasitica]|uniref:GH16 domain-containing protein n=1 Tax=Pseudovirgaria hyperparasitica TaxID=470096 RepID=A0A6A6VXB1_9PEZI|nr:uncharacterized protein EJ05DRAFT_540693 [Pseudovirgaria hyperparasitica]KAF2755242.1 hypothetical protein EJ05DRAFT_540693 [Pseudovirgaria hyperparasitica]
MVRFIVATALAALSSVALTQSIPSCGPNQPCPAETPCCSAYGQCGVGAYCLGGCDSKHSHKLDSCVPAPTCQNKNYKFDTLDSVMAIDEYLGDSTKADWVASGKPAIYNKGLLMTMAQDTVGTLLATTHYVWYGKISAKMTTSQGRGVVTAFIMMSDVKDEIDFEFIGVDLGKAQSNYYHQGVTVYTNSANLTVSNGNTVEQEHEYTIDWTPDQITWSIDGAEMRTVKKADTWNATANSFYYPQTPARVMLSLWPAGLPTNEEGTINWAGGVIDWNSNAMQNGYYYARVSEVNVECYDPPSGANVQGDKSYTYTDVAATNDTVKIGNDLVTLASFYATGENPKEDPHASASGSAASPSMTSAPETVPGMSGGGNRGDESGAGGADAGADPQASGAAGGDGSAPASGGGNGGFTQGGNTGVNTAAKVGGSTLAVLVAFMALLFL